MRMCISGTYSIGRLAASQAGVVAVAAALQVLRRFHCATVCAYCAKQVICVQTVKRFMMRLLSPTLCRVELFRVRGPHKAQ